MYIQLPRAVALIALVGLSHCTYDGQGAALDAPLLAALSDADDALLGRLRALPDVTDVEEVASPSADARAFAFTIA